MWWSLCFNGSRTKVWHTEPVIFTSYGILYFERVFVIGIAERTGLELQALNLFNSCSPTIPPRSHFTFVWSLHYRTSFAFRLYVHTCMHLFMTGHMLYAIHSLVECKHRWLRRVLARIDTQSPLSTHNTCLDTRATPPWHLYIPLSISV